MLSGIIKYIGLAVRMMVLATLHVLGSVVGYLLYVSRSRRCYYAHANINLCFPGLDAREINRLTRRSMHEMGKLMFEVMFFWFFPGSFYRGLIHKVTGEEHLLRARAEGRGVILISPHLGNWEVFNAYVGGFGAYVSYKPVTAAWLNRRIRHCRQCNGSKLFSIGNDGLKVLCGSLDKGETVVMFPDQVPPSSGGRIMSPFFGTPAWTGTLVSRLAGKKNVQVICGYARRLPNAAGFEICLQPAPEEIYSGDIERSVAALNRGMEASIRLSPEQYIWTYKRFKDTSNKRLYCRA